MIKEISKCCGKPKVSNYTDEGTGCYLCQGCLGEFIPQDTAEKEEMCKYGWDHLKKDCDCHSITPSSKENNIKMDGKKTFTATGTFPQESEWESSYWEQFNNRIGACFECCEAEELLNDIKSFIHEVETEAYERGKREMIRSAYKFPKWITEDMIENFLSMWTCFGRVPADYYEQKETLMNHRVCVAKTLIKDQEIEGIYFHKWSNIGWIKLNDGKVEHVANAKEKALLTK